MTITIGRVDFSVPEQADILVGLLDAYALDPMGGGAGLAPRSKPVWQNDSPMCLAP